MSIRWAYGHIKIWTVNAQLSARVVPPLPEVNLRDHGEADETLSVVR
jgi:hypothetical protein